MQRAAFSHQRMAAPEVATVLNPHGKSPWLIVCEHASNQLPQDFNRLGLTPRVLQSPIAWDKGAYHIANGMGRALDACVIMANYSRLLIDCSRSPHAPDLIPEVRDRVIIPGNQVLSDREREDRITRYHQPFHQIIDRLIARRHLRRRQTYVVSVHSFSPLLEGRLRPWQIGFLHIGDVRVADRMLEIFKGDPSLNVGANQPGPPSQIGSYTIERHANLRNAPAAIIALSQEVISFADDQEVWAMRLAQALRKITKQLAD